VPLRGAELVSAYSDSARGRHSLQIEINHRLIMDWSTRDRTAVFDPWRGHLDAPGPELRE